MSRDCVQNTEPGPGRQLGMLRSEDGDGSKNVAGKMNSRSFNLHRDYSTNFVDCRGAFHSPQNFGNFGWYIKCNGPFRFGPTGIFGNSFDRSGHFGRSDRNVSFHLSKLLPPVPNFCILLTRTSRLQSQVKRCK